VTGTDWAAWHAGYADPASPLSQRLAVVQAQVAQWLDRTHPRPVVVTSACAGDGRDLLDVLTGRPDAARVTATLVELDADLEIAMAPGVLTGFLSWLEAAPPGRTGYRQVS
jgi:hypothetical protein